MAPIAIIVHGGAGEIPDSLHADHWAGCLAAADTGWCILARGGCALDAVEAAVRVMEDREVFDAGRGSHLNRDGIAELDAALMDGRELRAGAVAAVRRIANPISLARKVLEETPHVLLVAEGAERFAVESGIPLCDPAELVVERERARWEQHRARLAVAAGGTGTVGAAALDAEGNLAAANSTGGMSFKYPGRVGDTPLIGSGLYADNALGAAVCTGWGEQIIQVVLAKTAVDRIAQLGDPAAAADAAIADFRRRIDGKGGVICLAPDGRVGVAHSTSHMSYAYRTSEMTGVVAMVGKHV